MAENLTTAAPEAPLSEEDRFAATVEAARAAKDTLATEAKPPPTAAPTPNTEGAQPERARDPATGKFLSTDAKPPAAAPFDGYENLPEAARKYLDKLQNDTKAAQNRAAAAQRDLERARRQAPPPRTPPQPQARAPAPAPQPRATPKWDAAKAEYPDFFASLEERMAATEAEQGRKLTALEQQQVKLDQQLQETRQIADRFQAREAEERKTHTREVLDTLSPEWKRTAGWVDDDGNAIHPDQQVFRPEFQAWLDALPPSVRAIKEAQLEHDDPHVLGSVFQEFDRDYAEAMGWTGNRPDANGNTATPARDPVAARRADALNDRQPRPNGGSPKRDPAPRPGDMSRGDAEEAAYLASIQPENMQRWRGLRT